MDNPIVEVNNVSMMFRLYRENVDSLKEFLIKKAKHQIAYEEFWALSDVNFQVGRGESVALIAGMAVEKVHFLRRLPVS